MPEHQQIQQSQKPEPFSQRRTTSKSQARESNPFSIIQRAKINPKSLSQADVMQLQRTIGNRAVGRLLSGVGSSSTTQHSTVQRQEIPEEEDPLQGKMAGTIQRQEPEEEELIQGKFETVQRQEPEEEELIQGKMIETIQCQEDPEEEEPLQGKMIETIQREESPEEEEPLQGKMIETIQRQEVPEEEDDICTLSKPVLELSPAQLKKNVIQRYDFGQDVQNNDWRTLFWGTSEGIRAYYSIIDIDMDHIERRHIEYNPFDEATHFNLNCLQVITLIKCALHYAEVTWVTATAITIQFNAGIPIGTNGEQNMRIFISTTGMDDANNWANAWVSTAYPY
ncbi:TPA: hypothetical protein HA351_13060 [Methanosarcinaceae archaeon]|nr:hypothetical protein [Methanosarcinaceae archaeon]